MVLINAGGNKPAQQVQSDWSETDTSDPSYIQNKPTIPTVDSAPTSGSSNAVSSGGVYTALAGKANLSGASFTGAVSTSGDMTTWGNLTCVDFKITNTWHSDSANSYVLVSNGGGTWVRLRTLAEFKGDLGVQAPEIFPSQSASSWVSDNTYSDYGYRCAIALTGVTASDVAEVVFSVSQASSGNYAPVCETYAGGVYIYSKSNDSITVPTIVIFKG